MFKMCATDPSEYYLEFLEHRTPDFYWVFMRRMQLWKSLLIAAGKITRKTLLSQSFYEYIYDLFEYIQKKSDLKQVKTITIHSKQRLN